MWPFKSKAEKEPKLSIGPFEEFKSCSSCGWTERPDSKDYKICPSCGHQTISKVIGRWHYQFVNFPMSAVSFNNYIRFERRDAIGAENEQ